MTEDQRHPVPAGYSDPSQLSALLWGAIRAKGFAFMRSVDTRALLERYGLEDWRGFEASWDDLGADRYMADGGRYRKRRFSAFTVGAGAIRRKAHQPHYQSRDFNPLNGGVSRWFEPVRDAIADHPATMAILKACDELFTALTPADARPASWHVELHQFRVEARSDEAGKPTPEGMHRDGVDWVLVMLVRRQNIARGVTTIGTGTGEPVETFTLTEAMDASFVDDNRVYHGVTPIHPLDAAQPAYRDVLVVTFRRE